MAVCAFYAAGSTHVGDVVEHEGEQREEAGEGHLWIRLEVFQSVISFFSD